MAAPKLAEQASVRPALHDCDVSCMKGAQCALMPGVSQQGKGGKSMRPPSGGWTASEAGGKGACHMAPLHSVCMRRVVSSGTTNNTCVQGSPHGGMWQYEYPAQSEPWTPGPNNELHDERVVSIMGQQPVRHGTGWGNAGSWSGSGYMLPEMLLLHQEQAEQKLCWHSTMRPMQR